MGPLHAPGSIECVAFVLPYHLQGFQGHVLNRSKMVFEFAPHFNRAVSPDARMVELKR